MNNTMWWALLNMMITFGFRKNRVISWPSKRLVLFQKDSVPWSHSFGYLEKEITDRHTVGLRVELLLNKTNIFCLNSAVHLSDQVFFAIV